MNANILYLNEVSWIGGAEGAMLDLVTNLDGSRFSPVAVCPENGEFPTMLETNSIPTHIVPFYGLRARNPLRYFETLAKLMYIAKNHNVRIIHVNHQYFSNYGVMLGRLCHLPVIVHLRGVETDAFFDQHARWLCRADKIICVSKAVRTRVLEYASKKLRCSLVNRLKQSTDVVYDGFKPSDQYIGQMKMRYEFGIPEPAKIVCIVGQTTPEKGLSEFVDAAAIVRSNYSDVHFLIVGADPDTERNFNDQLQTKVKELNMACCFTFTGFRRDAAALIQAGEISVLASWQDAFPRVVLESLAGGVPIVATRVGGVPEMIEDGISGLLVPSRNSYALADGILRILNMPEIDRRHMIAEGKKNVCKFDIKTHVEHVQSLYDSILASGKTRLPNQNEDKL